MMNKFLIFITCLVAGCATNNIKKTNLVATTNPTDVQDAYLYSTALYGSDNGGPTANIAVLLPMTGPAKSVSNNIKTSIETAFLRKPKQNIKLSFYDLSGDQERRDNVIEAAFTTRPDIVIGPLFASDVQKIHSIKPSKTPVISFTSDVKALGDDVITINLIPTQSIETIVQQMQKDGAKNMIILAPNDESGKMMTSVADKASILYNIPTKGVFYYDSANSESIKNVAMRASMYSARNAANDRAREILSDITTKERLDARTRANLKKQLEKLSRKETLGDLPYDAILFLGNGEDSKTLASFLRYYGIGNSDAAFYGTTLWDGSDIASDFTMSGAKYATLPEISENFTALYNMVAGQNPDYLAAFGYDAANLALGMLFSQKSSSSYLYDPSGYVGTTGIFRIQPSGDSERGLRIMELNGTGTASVLKEAPENFLSTLYNVNINNIKDVPEKELSTRGVNPGDYIKIPENLRKKSEYRTKTIGANYVNDNDEEKELAPIQIYESEEKEIVQNPEFEPVKLENISRKYIESVEIEE